MGEDVELLSQREADDLAGLEAVIARAVKTAGRIAGEALREIRERRLYRSSHGSWEAYVLDRCGFSVSTANRMIAVAEEKALEAETGRGDLDLPGTTRASRRARPDPEPSQREAARRRRDRQADANIGENPANIGGPPAVPDGPGPDRRQAAPAGVEEPQRPPRMSADRMRCPRCEGVGTVPRPSRQLEQAGVAKCQPRCSPNRIVAGTCMACGSKAR